MRMLSACPHFVKSLRLFLTAFFFFGLMPFFATAQQCPQNSVRFDGTNDYVDMGHCPSLSIKKSLTIEAWIFPTGTGKQGFGGVGGMIVNKEGEYEISMSPFGLQYALANTNPGWHWTQTGYTPPLNEWTHIALVYDYSSVTDLGTISLYVNGNPVPVYTFVGQGEIEDEYTEAAYGNTIVDKFNVGSRQNGIADDFFEGSIEEVRIWNTAVSPLNIGAWYNKSVTASHTQYANLVGYWKFDEGTGLTTADATGRNNGTLYNGVVWDNGVNMGANSCSSAPIPQIPCNGPVPPTPAQPVTITCPPNITISCEESTLPERTGRPTTNTDCPGGSTTSYTDVITPGSCAGKYTITRTWTASNSCNSSTTCTQTITVSDSKAPTFTAPADETIYTNASCQYDASPAVTGDVTNESDNCSTGLQATYTDVVTNGACTGSKIIKRTWKLVDACGNAAANQVQTITVSDNIAPTFTAPADKTIGFTSISAYNASPSVTGDVTNESDNCSTGLQATYTDAVNSCGNDIIITRTWKLVDKCNNTTTKTQTITVTDNPTKYIVYARLEAKFAELTGVLGAVGVTDASGKAEFKSLSIVPSPYFVKAKNITVYSWASVANKIAQAANDGPNPTHYSFTGTTSSLSTYTVNSSTSTPLSGNYKTLTVKKNVSVTLTGTLYGTITIEDGAQVTFNPAGGIVNIENLNVNGSQKLTKVSFTNPTSVRIKNKVDILNNCKINVGGPKVIFYFTDDNKDVDKFVVHGKCTWVNANVYVKTGRIRVYDCDDLNPTLMTGWFIAGRILSEAKAVLWSAYNTCCDDNDVNARNAGTMTMTTEMSNADVAHIESAPEMEPLSVKLYPNPSTTDFRLEVRSSSSEPVNIRITNTTGVVVGALTISAQKQPFITVGKEWRGGTYFAEIMQGKNKKVLKLIKTN